MMIDISLTDGLFPAPLPHGNDGGFWRLLPVIDLSSVSKRGAGDTPEALARGGEHAKVERLARAGLAERSLLVQGKDRFGLFEDFFRIRPAAHEQCQKDLDRDEPPRKLKAPFIEGMLLTALKRVWHLLLLFCARKLA